MKRPGATVRDVAALAGVSTATVSRVLNDDPGVSDPARRKVLGAVESLSYRVNRVARSLKTSTTRTVGIVAPAFDSVFFMSLAESLERELARAGYGVLLCSSRESGEEEQKRVRLMLERLVDAVVIIPATDSGARLAPMLGSGTPVVFVDRRVRDLELDAVVADNERGAYEATSALVADGFRRIGFLGGTLDVSTARERYSGYLRALRDAGLSEEPAFSSFGSLRIESGYRAMRAALAAPDPPRAFFVVNADTHLGAANCLVEAHEEARRRTVFAAFDEMPYAPLMRNCRYSVSQPVAEMGREAARLIMARIDGVSPGRPEIVRMPIRLIRHPAESPCGV